MNMKRLCAKCNIPLGRKGIRRDGIRINGSEKVPWFCSDCNHMIYETQMKNEMGRYTIRFKNKFMVDVYPIYGCSKLFEVYNFEHSCDFLIITGEPFFKFKQILGIVVPPDCTIEDLQTYIAFQ